MNLRIPRLFLLCILVPLLTRASDDSKSKNGETIEKIYTSVKGEIHIVSAGVDQVAPKQTDQVNCTSPQLAQGGRTAGWLVNSDNCCNSYPIPLSLVIFRYGRVIRRFHPGQSIWDWQFLKNDQKVAFWTGPTHGDIVPHFELHDVDSGRLLAHWDGHLTQKHPAWVSGLKE